MDPRNSLIINKNLNLARLPIPPRGHSFYCNNLRASSVSFQILVAPGIVPRKFGSVADNLAPIDEQTSPEKPNAWRSLPKIPNLFQYVNTGTYYARVKVAGKTIRRSLKTNHPRSNQEAGQTGGLTPILRHSLGIPANPTIPARQIEGGWTKTNLAQNITFTGHDQITQLRPHQRSPLEGVLATDEPVPDQVLGVLVSATKLRRNWEKEDGVSLGSGGKASPSRSPHDQQAAPISDGPDCPPDRR